MRVITSSATLCEEKHSGIREQRVTGVVILDRVHREETDDSYTEI